MEAVSTWRSLSPSSWLGSCVPFHSLLSTCGPGFGASRLFVCVCVCVSIRHNNLSPICLGSMARFMLWDFYVSWRKSRYAFDLVLCNIMRFLACCLCPQLGHSLTIFIYWRCCLQQFSFQRQALAPRLEESTRLVLSYLWVVFAFIHNLMRWGGFVNDNSAPRNLNAVDPMSNIVRTLLSSLAVSIRNTSQMYRLTAAFVELLGHLEYVALSLSLVWLLLSCEISTCWPGA